MRFYPFRPQMMKPHLELYERMGFKPQSRHLGPPVLYGSTEIGDVNTYVHVWAFQDLADRDAKRARMWADPEWLAYIKASSELGALVGQQNSILRAPPFFKLPGAPS